MPYSLQKKLDEFKIIKISTDKNNKKSCSYHCPMAYNYCGEAFCGPFADLLGERKEECLYGQNIIENLLKNKKIKTKENCKNLKLIGNKEYKFVKFITKGREIKISIIDETGYIGTYPQEEFDLKYLITKII